MSAVVWVLGGLGAWLVVSLPAALLLVAMGDRDERPADAPPALEELPVIAEEDRVPAPPHLRRGMLKPQT